MSQPPLGRLSTVDVLEIWASEAIDFTPWLAQEANLRLLGDTIGIDLELEAQEKDVGPFRADILCKDTVTDHWVLIENQLEKTNHIHLGQLLTYASGLKAVSIVWIARAFTEEHRAALDWLNEITDDRFNFFGLEIELWRIGDSPVAPKFNVVCKPNDWSKTIGEAAERINRGELSGTRQQQLRYWTAFRECLSLRGGPLKAGTPRAQNWMNFAIGRSGFWLSAFVNTREKRIGCSLVIRTPSTKHQFGELLRARASIEAEAGTPLEWFEMPERKSSEIVIRKYDTDSTIEIDWPGQFDWLANHLELLHRVFRQRVRNLGTPETEEMNNMPEHDAAL